jgi:uncharacterized protein YuzE
VNIDVRYDTERQLLYVQLKKPSGSVTHTEDFDRDRYVDYDESDEVVGVEFLAIKQEGLDLRGIPEADRIADALETLRELESVR